MNHPQVKHPTELLEADRANQNQALRWNDAVVTWLTNHILASVIMFDIAFIVPLLVIRAPVSVKVTLGVISGSWIQWWALPALQRSQNKIQAQNNAKADVDHETLTHLALLQDKQMEELTELKKQIEALQGRMK